MTIPAVITVGAFNMAPTFSGDLSTTRRRAVAVDGTAMQLDIIQSVPKRGRWRHVVRFTLTNPVNLAGIAPSLTFTVTMDTPENDNPTNVAAIWQQFLVGMETNWDEVLSGQS